MRAEADGDAFSVRYIMVCYLPQAFDVTDDDVFTHACKEHAKLKCCHDLALSCTGHRLC